MVDPLSVHVSSASPEAERTIPHSSSLFNLALAYRLCSECGGRLLPNGICSSVNSPAGSNCPDPTHDYRKRRSDDLLHKRDRLITNLLYASNSLAESRVKCVPSTFLGAGMIQCEECFAATGQGRLQHESLCGVGRVQGILEQLCALDLQSAPAEPAPVSAAADAETVQDAAPDAGAAIPIRKENTEQPENGAPVEAGEPPQEPVVNPSHRSCGRCGQVDENWDAELRWGVEVELSSLRSNQCVSASPDPDTHSLWTHRCKPIEASAPVAEFAEPWMQMKDRRGDGNSELIVDCNNRIRASVSWFWENSKETQERIVACVNFCSGLSTDMLCEALPLADLSRPLAERQMLEAILTSGGVR